MRDAIRLKHYSLRTEEAYTNWIKRNIYFHDIRHPTDMGAPEVRAFLVHLAVAGNIASSTQNQVLSALLSLYREVLHQESAPLTPCAQETRNTCPPSSPKKKCGKSWAIYRA